MIHMSQKKVVWCIALWGSKRPHVLLHPDRHRSPIGPRKIWRICRDVIKMVLVLYLKNIGNIYIYINI